MRRTNCRSCGSDRLRIVYDFGPQPLAGEFPLMPETSRAARRLPLDLTQCDACGLLQVTNRPPIDAVFHADYRYSSSTVPGLVQHFADYAEWLAEQLPNGASILEFGCNDGVLLTKLRAKGFSCIGVDASDNVARIAREQGLSVYTAFMSEAFVRSRDLEEKHDLVTCSNVLAHIDDVNAALSAVRLTLKPNGLLAIEVHDAAMLERHTQFETVYHEHLSYFTEATLHRLVAAHGFVLIGCSTTPMHGGALRFLCRRQQSTSIPALPFDSGERVDGSSFAATIQRCAHDVRTLATKYGPLDGYGAAGRSQMFLNTTGTTDRFAQIFDDSPFRQNRYIVGTDIPIRPYGGTHGRACVILAWNYASAIAERIRGQYEETLTLLPQWTRW